MLKTTKRKTWQEELAIIDRTLKAISSIGDPEELVEVYWTNIGDLVPSMDFVAMSRRNMPPPFYLVTRSTRFTEHFNPWTQRDRLPVLSGGLLGEIIYGNRPMIIDDLPARLAADDPGRFYVEGYQTVVAYPQYDGGEGLNATALLFPPGAEVDLTMVPILHWQSGLMGRGTQNLVLRNQLAEALEKLNAELQVVGDIQRSLLPDFLPAIPGFEIDAYYQTSARAGGDYYDFFPLENGRWGLFIADVAGHGTPAAVLMAITHAVAHAQPGTHQPPSALNRYLNERLTQAYTRGGTFVTAFYAVLDPATRLLTYSRAGHNPPRLMRGNNVMSIDGAGGLPLGIVADEDYKQSTVQLQPGDLFLMYTDGITEAMAPSKPDEDRQLFGTDRLDRVLLDSRGKSTSECIDRIRAEVMAFCGNAPPGDDQTLIAIRCL